MRKLIRRTASVTIIITETWTLVRSTEDDPLPSTLTVVQAHPNMQEEQDELLQATVSKAESGKPSARARKKRPPNDRKTMT